MDEKTWNINALQLGAMEGNVWRFAKKVSAYLVRNKQSVAHIKDYFEKYTEDDFDKMIKKEYDISGEVTDAKILKARLKNMITEGTEHEQQAELCRYLKTKNVKYFAVPNGTIFFTADRTLAARYSNYLHSEGVQNGAPDLVLLFGNGKVVFLEMKTSKGVMSEYQRNWQQYFNENDYIYCVCYGVENAKKIVDNFL